MYSPTEITEVQTETLQKTQREPSENPERTHKQPTENWQRMDREQESKTTPIFPNCKIFSMDSLVHTQGIIDWLYLLSSIMSQQVRKWLNDMQVTIFRVLIDLTLHVLKGIQQEY